MSEQSSRRETEPVPLDLTPCYYDVLNADPSFSAALELLAARCGLSRDGIVSLQTARLIHDFVELWHLPPTGYADTLVSLREAPVRLRAAFPRQSLPQGPVPENMGRGCRWLYEFRILGKSWHALAREAYRKERRVTVEEVRQTAEMVAERLGIVLSPRHRSPARISPGRDTPQSRTATRLADTEGPVRVSANPHRVYNRGGG